jgi:hypothetical protein
VGKIDLFSKTSYKPNHFTPFPARIPTLKSFLRL